jgi:hypothetical protein
MPGMREYDVSISRSATETATLKVMATSEAAAEAKISNMLDHPIRTELSDLDKVEGVKVTGVSFNADDESSWEVC